jgi:hypothetical protein
MAAIDAFVHQDMYNAMVKGFTEEEPNVVNQERKKRDQPRKGDGAAIRWTVAIC